MSYFKITIYDNTIPMLDEIAKISYGMGLDVLDHAGAKLRDGLRTSFRKAEKHGWGMKVPKNGKRYITYDKSQNNPLGIRYYHKTGDIAKTPSMENFITSYLMESKMTMVVGGKNPSFTPKTRRDGVVTGYEKRQSGVTLDSYLILKKLNSGNINEADEKKHLSYKTKLRPKSMPNFKNAKYKYRGWAEEGYANALPEVMTLMSSKYETLLMTKVNNLNIKEQKVS